MQITFQADSVRMRGLLSWKAEPELFFSANWSLLAKFEGEFGNGSQTYAGTGRIASCLRC